MTDYSRKRVLEFIRVEGCERVQATMSAAASILYLWAPTCMSDPTIVFFWALFLYWILLLMDWAIGRSLKDKFYKVWIVLKGWLNILSCGSLVIWALIALMKTVHNERGIGREEGDVFLMMGMGVLISILLSLLSFSINRQAPHSKNEKESTFAVKSILTASETYELADILIFVKNEVRKVREEMSDYFKNLKKTEKIGFMPVDEADAPMIGPTDKRREHNDIEMGNIQESAKGSKVCVRCGEVDHKSKDCIYIKLTCYRYGLRGHKAIMCPYTTHTDAKGRVVTRIENRPGSIKMFQRRDRTQGDALDTGESVINKLHVQLKVKAKKEKRWCEIKCLQKAMLEITPDENNDKTITDNNNGNRGESSSSSQEQSSNKKQKSELDTVLMSSKFAEFLSSSDSD